MMKNVNQLFKETYGDEASHNAEAPGRGNLIGEHTDYNMGFVMPFALEKTAKIALSVCSNVQADQVNLISSYDRKKISAVFGQKAQGLWIDYLMGVIHILRHDKKVDIPPLNIALDSDVPLGAGVSSSAAIEVAMLRALSALLKLNLSDIDIAQLAQKAENDYVGMPCGIMDQMASSVGRYGDVLFIDTQDLSYENVQIPEGWSLVVLASGISHALVDGEYEKRREQCIEACQKLKISSLRMLDLSDMPRIEALPEPLNRRARHVVSENQRVLEMKKALQKNDMPQAGQILIQGHLSEKDDYEITISETDQLTTDMVRYGALGARQIGGGFGGSCIALIQTEYIEKWWKKVKSSHPKATLVT